MCEPMIHLLSVSACPTQDLWMEYANMERIQHEFQETVALWTQAKLESHSVPCSSSTQLDFTDPLLGEYYDINPLKERVLESALMKAKVSTLYLSNENCSLRVPCLKKSYKNKNKIHCLSC